MYVNRVYTIEYTPERLDKDRKPRWQFSVAGGKIGNCLNNSPVVVFANHVTSLGFLSTYMPSSYSLCVHRNVMHVLPLTFRQLKTI